MLLRHRDRLPVLPLEVAPVDDPVQVEVGPGAHVVADRARGGTMDWQAAWRVVIRNLPGLLVTSIFVFVGVVIGLMLCIVPGIVFGLLCAFTVPVILLEKKSGTRGDGTTLFFRVGSLDFGIRVVARISRRLAHPLERV